MDPPSPQLVARLTETGLCRPRDLRRCRTRVRRLARDVPAFETIWLDALVQTRTLTAFQADVLGSDYPERLSVGPFLLIDRAGDDGRFLHFQARRRDAANPFLLSRPHSEPDSRIAAEERLRAFRERTTAVNHPGLAILHGFERVDNRLWVAAPWTDGASLQQLLVRRGRLLPTHAAAIGLQLCDALAALEQVGALHGDLRLRNVRLTPRGQAVLVVPGLRAALFPDRSIHSQTPPDDADGAAPELIGTGQHATVSSDLYALGCLLWELLAGRPPFPHGDPLAKLAAHQSQRIADVRDWAPETPAAFAELIARLTHRNPAERPQSFREAAAALRLRPAARAARRHLVQLALGNTSPAAVNRVDAESPRSAAPALAAGVLLLAIGGLAALNSGARHELLSIGRRTTAPAVRDATPSRLEGAPHPPAAAADRPVVQSLPQPDARGVIELAGPGPFAARDLTAAGKLEIRGTGRVPPLIQVGPRPFRVSAGQLLLASVQLAAADEHPDPAARPDALLHVEAGQLAIRHCRFTTAATNRPAVDWTTADSRSPATRDCLVIETAFIGNGPALRSNAPPSSVTFDNVLHCGGSPLLELAPGNGRRQNIDVTVRRTTLRGGTLLACRVPTGDPLPGVVTLTLEDSVFALLQSALVEFHGPDAPLDWQRALRITGESSLVPAAAEIVGVRTGALRLRPLPVNEIPIEGLMTADLNFAGPAGLDSAASTLVNHRGYARTASPPGIDAARLPAPAPPSYNSSDVIPPIDPQSNPDRSLE